MLSIAPCEVQQVDLAPTLIAVHLPLYAQAMSHEFQKILTEKDRVVGECLCKVEELVDSFLTQNYGFDHAAIPFNYLDQPPSSLEKVDENLSILMHCLAEMYLPTSPIRVNVMELLRKQLYRDYLTPLKNRLQNYLALGNALPAEDRRRISADVEHLIAMESLEETFLDDKHKGQGLSHVVPISGLVASRLHRLENEARTVLVHWRRR